MAQCYVCHKHVDPDGGWEVGYCDDCGTYWHYPDCDQGFNYGPCSHVCTPCWVKDHPEEECR